MARLRGEAKRAWERSVRLYERLRAGGDPGTVVVPDVDLGPDEVCIAECGFTFEAWIPVEHTITYRERAAPFTLNPFRRVGDAMERAANRAEFERLRREGADVEDHVWFEEEEPVRAVLTDQRLVCDRAGHRFEYRHADLAGLEFDIDEWAIELRYSGAAPIRLSGWDAFPYGILLAWLDGGPQALSAPAFEPFRQG